MVRNMYNEGYTQALKDLYNWYVKDEHYRPDSTAAQMMNTLYKVKTGETLGSGGEYERHHDILEG